MLLESKLRLAEHFSAYFEMIFYTMHKIVYLLANVEYIINREIQNLT